MLATPLSRAQVLEAVEALRRRSLLERGKHPGSFTLQAVVLEYATGRLIAEAASEVEQGTLSRLIEHGLSQANAKDYVRQTQERLIVAPLLAQMQSVYLGRAAVKEHLLALLDQLRTRADYAQGYGPANLLALLREQRGHLRGLPELRVRYPDLPPPVCDELTARMRLFEAVVRLLAALARRAPLEALGDFLFAQTGGQPLYLLETLKLLCERMWLVPQPGGDGTWRLEPSTDLPPPLPRSSPGANYYRPRCEHRCERAWRSRRQRRSRW